MFVQTHNAMQTHLESSVRGFQRMISTAPFDKMSPASQSIFFFFLGGIIMLIIVLFLAFVFLRIIKPTDLKKFVKRAKGRPVSTDLFTRNLRTISIFDFQTLKKATKNFHPGNLLGRGGFGPVFRGKLGDGRLIAVKKLSLNNTQQGESEFLSEVRMITSIQHKNLVHLLGCCSDGPQRGYSAPEYAIRGELSEKADIYSFGVLVLEIISCRKNTDQNLPSVMQYLPEYAWRLYETSKVLELVDPRMREDGFLEKDVLQAINVAFLCLQPDPEHRPPMSHIVTMLTGNVNMVGAPMKPASLDRKRRKDDSPSCETLSEPFPSSLQTDSCSPNPPK
ncbi:hypothetical protein G4B88_002476 [Cannabis sativa]|uniref:Protein kinase domain-containing protein n=1 Tax=Cannabis sativa TaxID=3483 RepID=A0A7J6I7T6_CANSA|nr:hypothetical protein G4B88_002476 [Cannabis sativa]